MLRHMLRRSVSISGMVFANTHHNDASQAMHMHSSAQLFSILAPGSCLIEVSVWPPVHDSTQPFAKDLEAQLFSLAQCRIGYNQWDSSHPTSCIHCARSSRIVLSVSISWWPVGQDGAMALTRAVESAIHINIPLSRACSQSKRLWNWRVTTPINMS